jgi:hypothetical protein
MTFGGSAGTLELGTAGTLTLTNALSILSNTVQLDGPSSHLTDNAGISLSTGTITGLGIVTGAINATGAAHITANGGTLEIASNVSKTGAGSVALTVGSGASDRLKLDGTSTATSLTFSGSTGTLELNTSGTLALTSSLSIGANTVQLDGSSSHLTDNAGISLSTGTITGLGTVTGAITASSTAHITANGGTLTIANGITDGGSALTLTITGNSDRLVLNGTDAAHTVSFGGSGTLEIGAAATLTVGTSTSITSGTIQLDGGTLTDVSGLTIGSLATLIGSGTVSGSLGGSGIVEASGGTLHLTSAVTNALGGYRINGASSVLQLDSTLASNNIVFTFLNAASGGLGLSSDSGLVGPNSDSMSGLDVSTGGVRTNFIDIEGHTVTVSSIVHNGTTSGTVTLSDGAVLNLTNIVNGSSSWFADTATDGSGGTYVFLSNTVCFMPGTRILTPAGEVAVEALKAGDLVTTAEGKSMPIRWVGRQTVSRVFADPLRVLPIRITQGALGDNMPSRDLLVSPDHALLIDGALIQAGALVNDTSIAREIMVPERFTYYHVELADHSLILAENTPAETFIDNIDRMAFDNWDEHDALPDAGDMQLVEMGYPRAKASRQVPRATRDRLARRAEARNGLSQVA